LARFISASASPFSYRRDGATTANEPTVQPKSSRGSPQGKTLQKTSRRNYGVGAGEVVVVVVVLEESLGEEPVFTVVFVSVFSVVAGEGFTTVVLFSVFFSAGGLVVSVFCSHAASKAAPARMEMYFFMISWMESPNVG
jgi:hypothetical protein